MTLPSVERELRNQIRELQEEKYTVGTVILTEVTGVINKADYLSEEQKKNLLNSLWKGRKESHK